jgi:DNA modification methylase
MENFLNKIINGNSLEVLKTIPDNSIDCCITSPPYWGLRDYGHDEQLGGESDFKQFVINLANVFDEVKRVLKPTGTCFVNLGDTYASGVRAKNGADVNTNDPKNPNANRSKVAPNRMGCGLPEKCLCLVPERFSIEMIDRGWILRNTIIWHKPNQMPQSATDRFTVDFEKIYFFTKNSTGYYFEQQLEPYTKPLDRWGGDDLDANGKSEWDEGTGQTSYRKRNMRPNPDGKNMRTVWSINTEPNREVHFATYPQRLVERMLKAGCPENGIVLDPFFGSGTTGVYARKVNRNFIGIELNPEYVKIAENRLLKEIGMFL